VALSGNTIVVGAHNYSGNGAVFIFNLNGMDDPWTQTSVLFPSNSSLNAQFGYSVALYGNTLAVSSPNLGQVSVYKYNGIDWILSSNLSSHDYLRFGEAVTVYTNTIVVGSRSSPGAVQVYTSVLRSDFKLSQTWIPSNTARYFGSWLSLEYDTLLIGALHVDPLPGNVTSPVVLDATYVGYLDCPSGREGIYCFDINECNSTTTKYCSEICVNTDGWFDCKCFDGTSKCLRPEGSPGSTVGMSMFMRSVLLWALGGGFCVAAILVLVCFIKKKSEGGRFMLLPEESDDEEQEEMVGGIELAEKEQELQRDDVYEEEDLKD